MNNLNHTHRSTEEALLYFRKDATYRYVWYLTESEQSELITHILQRSNDTIIVNAIYQDEHDHYKDKIDVTHKDLTIHTYEVVYLNTSFIEMEEADAEGQIREILISCRQVTGRVGYALIQPRYRSMTDDKYYRIKEYIPT